MDKEYFVKDGALFCNTLFKRDDIPDEVREQISLENSEPIKSFYQLDKIIAANVSGIKRHSTIRLIGGDSFTVQIPFKELVKLKFNIEI